MNIKQFKTHSLNVATYLKMNGFKVIDDFEENGKTVFVFEKSDALYKCVDEYNKDDRLKLFISTYREIRALTKKHNKK